MPFRSILIWWTDCTPDLIVRVLPKKPRNPGARPWSEGCDHRAVRGAAADVKNITITSTAHRHGWAPRLPHAMGNRSTTPHASIRESKSSINPGSAECSNALRFGATYCASSANIRARNSTAFFLSSAIRAMPVIGSQRSAANFSITSRVRRFGTPWRPPRRSPGLDPPLAMTAQFLFVATLAAKYQGMRSSAPS